MVPGSIWLPKAEMIHIAPVRIMPTLGVFGDILYSFAHNETMSVRSVFFTVHIFAVIRFYGYEVMRFYGHKVIRFYGYKVV